MQYFKFDDEVHAYQTFVRNNISALGDLLIITEQLQIEYQGKHFIDILALDLIEKRLVILELKNKTAKTNVEQPIRYYDLLIRAEDQLRNMLLLKKSQIPFDIDEINYNPRVLLIVPDYTKQLLRSLSYIRDIDVEVVKFNAIQKTGYFEIIKESHLPGDEIDFNEQVNITEKVTKTWNLNQYIEDGINQRKIDLVKQLINYMKNQLLLENKMLDIYYYENKITLMIDKKLWGHCNIRVKPLSPDLSVNINNKELNLHSGDLMYDGDIIDYKILTNNVKINFYQVPVKFLQKCI